MTEVSSSRELSLHTAVAATTTTGPLPEPLELIEPSDDNIVYPTGPKLWLTMACVCTSYFLVGLDLAIVAVAVPSLTDDFRTVADIGWYSAADGLTASAFMFFFGNLYNVFAMKAVFLTGIAIFGAGSLVCTLSHSSPIFILGRAVSGIGSSAIDGGALMILKHLFPLSQQGIMVSMVGGCQSVGLVIAPLIGGALIDAFGWRACFAINVPLSVASIILSIYSFHVSANDPLHDSTLMDKLKKINWIDTVLVVPSITCLMIALQWGGTKYGWGSPRIIGLFIAFGISFAGFGYLQYRQGEKATIPMRILRKRSIIAGMWFSSCCNGVVAVTEYYMSIYFQGVRGYTAFKSGLLALPMLGGLSAAAIGAGLAVTFIGYYSPFMFATSILAPIASGLLTTLNLEESVAKPAALIAFLGFAIGIGVQGPLLAIQTVLSSPDVPIGTAIVGFGGNMGSAMWVVASASLFDNKLVAEIERYSPNTDPADLQSAGLANLRNYIGSTHLKAALTGYDRAVAQTLYMPLGLGVMTILGSLAMEMRSIKLKPA